MVLRPVRSEVIFFHFFERWSYQSLVQVSLDWLKIKFRRGSFLVLCALNALERTLIQTLFLCAQRSHLCFSLHIRYLRLDLYTSAHPSLLAIESRTRSVKIAIMSRFKVIPFRPMSSWPNFPRYADHVERKFSSTRELSRSASS